MTTYQVAEISNLKKTGWYKPKLNQYIYLLPPWSRVLLEKLTGSQLVKKFPAFYGIRRFITEFTSARYLFLFLASSIQSIPPHPTSWWSILILSPSTPGSTKWFFPSGFPTKTLYTPLPSPLRATWPAHLILLDLITRTIVGEEEDNKINVYYTKIIHFSPVLQAWTGSS
jgi:hypothetical protein